MNLEEHLQSLRILRTFWETNCFPYGHSVFQNASCCSFLPSETSQVSAKYLPVIMGKEIENHRFLCCVTPLAMSITGITPTSAPLHVDPISSNDHILRCNLTLNTLVLPSTLWVVQYIERSQHWMGQATESTRYYSMIVLCTSFCFRTTGDGLFHLGTEAQHWTPSVCEVVMGSTRACSRTFFTIDWHHYGVPLHRFQLQSGTCRWPQV